MLIEHHPAGFSDTGRRLRSGIATTVALTGSAAIGIGRVVVGCARNVAAATAVTVHSADVRIDAVRAGVIAFSFCTPTDGLQSSFRLPRRVTDNREQSDVVKSLLGRRACLLERIETIGKSRHINSDVV